MTEDPIERNMHFLVEQQAQFSADIERLKGTQERTQQQLEANQKQLEKNQQQIYDLAGALTTVVRLYGEMSEKQKELIEAQKKTEAQQAVTGERLQIFIDVVESFFRKRHDQEEG
jgi:septal ring factor EnvC (AmiA/AmiB activator)